MEPSATLTLVDQLVETLTDAPLDATELGARLGTITDEGAHAVYVDCTSPGATQAVVTKEEGTGNAAFVELTIPSEHGVSLDELARRYGEHSVPPKVSWTAPDQVMFWVPPREGAPFSVVVVAYVEELTQEPLGGTILSLALRRDPT